MNLFKGWFGKGAGPEPKYIETGEEAVTDIEGWIPTTAKINVKKAKLKITFTSGNSTEIAIYGTVRRSIINERFRIPPEIHTVEQIQFMELDCGRYSQSVKSGFNFKNADHWEIIEGSIEDHYVECQDYTWGVVGQKRSKVLNRV